MHARYTNVFRPGRIVGLAMLALLVGSAAAGTGNYLIITAQNYAGTAPLTQFAAAKGAQGFTVSTYVAAPGTTNAQIKAYIQSLWGGPAAPRYILIVGDTDGYTAGVNTIPHWTGGGDHQSTTDLPYACMGPGDDWYPDICIGRFSVRTVAQLQAVVAKSLFVEAGVFPDPDYPRRATFLASNDMTSGAEETHDWVIDTYMTPAQFESTRIYARLGGGAADITSAVNRGTLIMVYLGHSSSGGWSAPGFGQGDVNALANAGRYGLVFGFSCNSAQFDVEECFGETWQRVAERGAAAYLSAASYIYWGDYEAWRHSRDLEKYYYQSFFVDGIWEVRPAWDLALNRLLAQYGPGDPAVRNFFEEFVLLGDPSLHLPEGIGFLTTADPAVLMLCAPPATQAVYTIRVDRCGDFAEEVTLSAAGPPPGASVSFVAGGSPGSYRIDVTGTSESFERTITVELDLSVAAPTPVMLTSPPDGAGDIGRMPTLTWEVVPQAVEYDVEIATNPEFASPVYSATAAEATHTLDVLLNATTLYYWRVRAVNGCGAGAWSAGFSFTTLAQAEYFTELLENFDLEYRTFRLIPSGAPDFYRLCPEPATHLPTDPASGTPLQLSDDSWLEVDLAESQAVQLYNLAYTRFFVGSNGYITFAAGDTAYAPSLADHFDLPRIAAVYDDLNPGVGGEVSWKQLDDRAVVTFVNVPEYGTQNQNTFQIEMYYEGEIRITWLRVDSPASLAGLSRGEGIPPDFIESDLSAAVSCGAHPPLADDSEVVVAVNTPEIVMLLAADDGTPDPLTYIILSLPAHGTVRDEANGHIVGGGDLPYALTSHGSLIRYSPATDYYGDDALTFKANDGGVPPDGGDSNIATDALSVQYGPPAITLAALPEGCPDRTYDCQMEAAEGQPVLSWSVIPGGAYAETDLGSSQFQAVGTAQGWHADDNVWSYVLPFTFRFYQQDYTSVWVCSNGFLNFGVADAGWDNSDGGLISQTRIAAMWDDLRTDGSGDIYIDADAGHATFRWAGTTYSGGYPVNFAVTLLADGRIRLHYGNGNTGITATIGISAGDGVNYVLSRYNNVPELPNANSLEYGPLPSLPTGLTLSPDGRLAGRPTQTGTFFPLIRVTDSLGRSDEHEFTLVIDPVCPYPLGDLNCDGAVNNFDITPFVLALTNIEAYYAAHPDCYHTNADINNDGRVDNFDISPFVELLTGD
jgi:hypothetical protein